MRDILESAAKVLMADSGHLWYSELNASRTERNQEMLVTVIYTLLPYAQHALQAAKSVIWGE